MRRVCVAGVVLVAALYAMAATAAASGAIKLCVPKKEGSAITTPKHGKCKKGFKLTGLSAEGKQGKEGKTGTEGKKGPEGKQGAAGTTGLSGSELETLKALLPHIRVRSAPVSPRSRRSSSRA